MKYLILNLIGILVFAQLTAQTANDGIVNLEVISLSQAKLPDLYYQASSGDFAALPIGLQNRGTPVKWQRANSFAFFTKNTAEKGQTQMERLMETPVPDGDGNVLICIYQNQEGHSKAQAIVNDEKEHKALTARIINLTDTEIGYALADSTYRIGPRGDDVIRLEVSLNERFRFGFQFLDTNQMPIRSPMKTLRFLNANSRITAIFAYTSELKQDGSGGTVATMKPFAFRIYDSIQP